MKRSTLLPLFSLVLAVAASAQTIDKPVATVKLIKQEVISVRQLKSDLDKVEAAAGVKLTADQRRQLLDGKINSLLFFQYCEREKIFVSDAEITTAIGQMKANLGIGQDDAKLEAALRSQGVFADARTYVKQQLLFRNYIQQKRSADLKTLQAPSADEVLKAYDLAKASLVRPDTLRVSIIYVDLRGLSADAKAKAGDALRQVAAQLKSNAGRFDELVIRSADAGSLYKASPSVYVSKTTQYQDLYGAVFMDKVFKLKAGDVSDLIENEAGLQIVRVNEVLPQKQLTLSDSVPGQQATVQDLIMQQLANEKQSKLLEKIQTDLIAGLRAEGKVTIYDENLSF
jgi:parvulin-like peptidyl-prolyl isomerase